MAILLFCCIAVFVFIKSQIHLVKSNDRESSDYSIIETDNVNLSTIEEIAEYAKIKTADKLSFAQQNDIANNKANCVGYAKVAASLCNRLFKYNKIDAHAKAVVGYYYLGNINIHNVVTQCFSNQQIINFIKDHDYVEIINSSGEVVYSFDPSIYDLTKLNFHE